MTCILPGKRRAWQEGTLRRHAASRLADTTVVLFADFDDVVAQVAQAAHLPDGDDVRQKERVRTVKRQLNGQVLARTTPTRATECDATGDVRGWLGQIDQLIAAHQ